MASLIGLPSAALMAQSGIGNGEGLGTLSAASGAGLEVHSVRFAASSILQILVGHLLSSIAVAQGGTILEGLGGACLTTGAGLVIHSGGVAASSGLQILGLCNFLSEAVGMIQLSLDHIAALGALDGIRLSGATLMVGGMSSLVHLYIADRADMPVVGFILAPHGGSGMRQGLARFKGRSTLLAAGAGVVVSGLSSAGSSACQILRVSVLLVKDVGVSALDGNRGNRSRRVYKGGITVTTANKINVTKRVNSRHGNINRSFNRHYRLFAGQLTTFNTTGRSKVTRSRRILKCRKRAIRGILLVINQVGIQPVTISALIVNFILRQSHSFRCNKLKAESCDLITLRINLHRINNVCCSGSLSNLSNVCRNLQFRFFLRTGQHGKVKQHQKSQQNTEKRFAFFHFLTPSC